MSLFVKLPARCSAKFSKMKFHIINHIDINIPVLVYTYNHSFHYGTILYINHDCTLLTKSNHMIEIPLEEIVYIWQPRGKSGVCMSKLDFLRSYLHAINKMKLFKDDDSEIRKIS
ncbi:MAG: hypothetical protein Q4P72_04320 [Eubacteriales bacterium]|nr:hypothetical protein [Eubacteriales bacterium]